MLAAGEGRQKLAAGEGRQKSTAKSSSASKWYGIWTCYLSTDIGSMACSSTPGGRSRLCDINLDEVGSCSHLMAGRKMYKGFPKHIKRCLQHIYG